MAYLVDEKAAERSRNHPTKKKAARLQASKAERRRKRRQERDAAYSRSKSGPVRTYRPSSIEVKELTFYDSQEWKDLRYKVLIRDNATCQCCGSTRKDGVRIHVDHIKPRSRFPQLELDENNLQVLCEPCNMGKRARDLTDWR
jgi:5-methylcytosine-specific restriction endonuclease McrA